MQNINNIKNKKYIYFFPTITDQNLLSIDSILLHLFFKAETQY